MNIQEASGTFYKRICIALIWMAVFYSAVIQDKFIAIPHGMLLLGGAIMVAFFLANSGKSFDLRDILTDESVCLVAYMAYMLVVGLIFSEDISSHISQWVTCLEYLFLLMIICSIIIQTGSDTFQILLLMTAIALAIVFIREPVPYGGGRYSITVKTNPNGLGMNFTTGIWVVLYLQQRKKMPLIPGFALIAVFGYCIMQTGSRKSLIAAGIVLALWLLLCFLPSLKGQGGARSFFQVVILILIVVVLWRAFLNTYSGSVISDRMNDLAYGITEGSRSEMYRNGFKLLKTNLLFGLGFQGYTYHYGSYSHATLVEIPVSGGVFGSLLYIGVYFISIKKTLGMIGATRAKQELATEHAKARMLLVLWVAMLFYTTCIIHQYQFESFVLFGIIFGQTSYIERRVNELSAEQRTEERMGSKYIRYD